MISAVLLNADEIPKKLRGIPPRVEDLLKLEVEKLSIKLLRKVKEEKLSGQVLRNKTGTLRASINYRIAVEPGRIVGIVGTNKSYAAAHEFGFHDVVTVREHLRMITKVFGKTIKSPKQITVRAHQKKSNLPQRSFLRSSLLEMESQITLSLKQALERFSNGS